MRGGVGADVHRYLTRTACECSQLACIGAHGCHGTAALQHRLILVYLRGCRRAVHIGYIRHNASEVLGRRLDAEAEGGLENHRSRLHKALSYRAVGRLTEVAALGMLQVCASGNQRYLHVGQGGTDEYAAVYSLIHVGEYESLPIRGEQVGLAVARRQIARALG